MTDNIDNATEVASERVEVPSDPGGYVIRSCDAIGWSMEDEEYDSIESASARIDVLRKRHPTIRIFRILRIPPQGEQVADDGMVRVDRETLAEMYEHFTMRTDEDAIVFGATLKLILGDHHKKGGA